MDNSGSDNFQASFHTPTLLMSDEIEEQENTLISATWQGAHNLAPHKTGGKNNATEQNKNT